MELLNQNKAPIASQTFASATATPSIDVTGASVIAFSIVAAVATPVAVVVPSASIDPTANTFTKTAHGLITGVKGQLTTSGGLPAPLLVSTDYFVIVIDANVFNLASTLVNALAGTAIDITTAGTGNQTFTPVALAGGAAQLEKSMDEGPDSAKRWFPEGSSTNITANANLWFEKENPAGNFYRVNFAITAGALTVSGATLGKGIA